MFQLSLTARSGAFVLSLASCLGYRYGDTEMTRGLPLSALTIAILTFIGILLASGTAVATPIAIVGLILVGGLLCGWVYMNRND